MGARYEVEDGILHACISGVYGKREAMQNRDNIASMLRKHDLRLVMVDLRETTTIPSTTDIYEVNSSIEGLVPKDVRIAFVSSLEFLPAELSTFAENVVVNLGFQARMFLELAEAIRWLREAPRQ